MSDEMITCQECGEGIHIVKAHLEKKHASDGLTLEIYQQKHPMAPLMSKKAEAAIAERTGKAAPVEATIKGVVTAAAAAVAAKQPFHTLFGFPATNKDAMSARGAPINISVIDPATLGAERALIPDRDADYVFDANLAKTVVMGLEMNVPIYLHGHAGVGKTSLFEQVAAITNRPYTRVQHTANMEEADVEGRWVVNAESQMEFQNGPLTDAMEQGHIYCADEYDFASPMILSVYQAVLEGKPLFIKAANKKIYPHKNFRFCASGNTNGAGDESGLYQGTMMQNAANYERFGIVERVNYMPHKSETEILTRKTTISPADAKQVVDFATKMREAFDKKEVAIPMSPRSTLNAAKLGVARADMKYGITVAYINRLPTTSADTARQVMQRIFG